MMVAEYSENVHVILIDWTESEDILTDKTQCVSVGGEWSEDRPVINGVPLGSVVLHYLSVLINYMPEIQECFIKIFTDDTTIIIILKIIIQLYNYYIENNNNLAAKALKLNFDAL